MGIMDFVQETSETLVKTAPLNCRVHTQMGGENKKVWRP